MQPEENVRPGGMGEAVVEYLDSIGAQVPVLLAAIEDGFIPHGNAEVLKREAGLDADSIADNIKTAMKRIRRKTVGI